MFISSAVAMAVQGISFIETFLTWYIYSIKDVLYTLLFHFLLKRKVHLFTNCVDPVQTLHVKMSTIVGILTYMSKKNSIIDLSKPVKTEFLDTFILMSI